MKQRRRRKGRRRKGRRCRRRGGRGGGVGGGEEAEEERIQRKRRSGRRERCTWNRILLPHFLSRLLTITVKSDEWARKEAITCRDVPAMVGGGRHSPPLSSCRPPQFSADHLPRGCY